MLFVELHTMDNNTIQYVYNMYTYETPIQYPLPI